MRFLGLVAADLAATYGARLTIVNVTPLSLTVSEIERMPHAKHFPKAVRDEIAQVRELLGRAAVADDVLYADLPAPNAALSALSDEILREAETVAKRKKVKRVARVTLTGDPAQSLLEQAKKTKADLIVMGTRGLSDLGGLVIGSVSHKVMHLADCPCLTAK